MPRMLPRRRASPLLVAAPSLPRRPSTADRAKDGHPHNPLADLGRQTDGPGLVLDRLERPKANLAIFYLQHQTMKIAVLCKRAHSTDDISRGPIRRVRARLWRVITAVLPRAILPARV
jgi:hypothetical protein